MADYYRYMSECPECGDSFKNEQGMKSHHAQVHGKSIAGVPATCEWCGQEDRVMESQLDSKDKHFCSYDCMGSWLSEHKEGTSRTFPDELQDEAKLRELYWGEGKSLPEIADIAGTSTKPVVAWMDRFDIGRRSIESGEGHMHHKRVTITCDYCDGEVKRIPSQVPDSDMHFCSDECRNNYRSENWSGDSHPGYNRVKVNCYWCDDEILKRPSRMDRSERKFCSSECEVAWRNEEFNGRDHPLFEGGRFPYGPGWNRTKREAVKCRDGYECQGCGTSNDTHVSEQGRQLFVHHICGARNSTNPAVYNAKRNLITLCVRCHPTWDATTPGIPQGEKQPAN